MRKKIENRGGPRPNSGAKKKGSEHRIKISFTLEPKCKDFLDRLAETEKLSRSDFINRLILEMMADYDCPLPELKTSGYVRVLYRRVPGHLSKQGIKTPGYIRLKERNKQQAKTETEEINELFKLYQSGLTMAQIARAKRVSRQTIHKKVSKHPEYQKKR